VEVPELGARIEARLVDTAISHRMSAAVAGSGAHAEGSSDPQLARG